MNEDLHTSNVGINLIKSSESFAPNAYPDPGSGGEPWTIGYGHTQDVQAGDTCDEEQADIWLRSDIDPCEQAIYDSVTCELNQNEFDALVDFIFNEGAGNLKASTMLKMINEGDMTDADAQFARWNRASGHILKGLVTRRAAEAALFNKPPEAA